MKLLVLATGYPTETRIYESAFLRPRVVAYREAGHEVNVLNFKAERAYRLDGVPVLSPGDLEGVVWDWDLCIFHAPNLRNHLQFIVRNWSRLPAVCFTFHGHEAAYLKVTYPEPFEWTRGSFYQLKRAVQHSYDILKLVILRSTIRLLARRNRGLLILFVSEDFLKTGVENLHLHTPELRGLTYAVWNPLGEAFLRMKHHCREPLADFLTIRPLDQSKHSIDLVLECAVQNPNHTFHIYGEGKYFEHNPTPPNVTHFPGFIPASELPELLGRYRGALMPSRWDSHGVMMCEMAVTGMPVLASLLDIHLEVLGGFPNVRFLDNENPHFEAEEFLESCKLADNQVLPDRFGLENTAGRELTLFTQLLR